jgi:hypothetical protein
MRITQISQIVESALRTAFGRLLRRALGAGLFVLLALTAIYNLTIASLLALEADYGLLHARLIVGAIYAAAALAVLIVLAVTRAKPLVEESAAAAPPSPRNMQIAMLIEAVMLGYTLAAKSGSHGRRDS